MCWGSGISSREVSRIYKLIQKAESLVIIWRLWKPSETGDLRKLVSITDNTSQPLHRFWWDSGARFFYQTATAPLSSRDIQEIIPPICNNALQQLLVVWEVSGTLALLLITLIITVLVHAAISNH